MREELAGYGAEGSLGVVLGSGLSAIEGYVEAERRIPYGNIHGLPLPAVKGHPGELIMTVIGGRRVFMFLGRTHPYEGASWEKCAAVVKIARRLGCRSLLITQAAGSLSAEIPAGVWLLASGICSFGIRLITRRGGAEIEGRGMDYHCSGIPCQLNSTRLYREIRGGAEMAGVQIREGNLFWTAGPCYETPSEARMLSWMGASAVTMSSLPEVLAASRLGMTAACLSWITNHTPNVGGGEVDHDSVLKSGRSGARMLLAIIENMIALQGQG